MTIHKKKPFHKIVDIVLSRSRNQKWSLLRHASKVYDEFQTNWIFRRETKTSLLSQISIYKASALWSDAFYKLKCPSVCPSVRPYVHLFVCSLLRYCLNVFLPPLPKVGCPIFLEIRNPWGKVMERSGLRYEHFCLKIV